MLEFLVEHFRGLRGEGLPTDSRHFNGHKLRPSPSRHILYSYEVEFIQSLLSTGKKKLASQFNFTYRYINDELSINNPDFENYLGQMYPSELEIKDTTESNTLLPTLIYSCRSRVTVSFAPPFTTNVTISTSISQTFRSWVAIFHLRQPMVFSSHSSYGMPGLAPLMDVLFWGRRDFHLSSSDRDMSWNVWNRPSESFMVDIGILSNIMLHDILGHDHIQWQTQLIRHYKNLRTYYRTGLYYQFWPHYQIVEVSIEHCNGCS